MTLVIWYKLLASIGIASFLMMIFSNLLGLGKWAILIFRFNVAFVVVIALTFVWFGAP